MTEKYIQINKKNALKSWNLHKIYNTIMNKYYIIYIQLNYEKLIQDIYYA